MYHVPKSRKLRINSIEEEIKTKEQQLVKAKEKYEKIADEILELQKKKEEAEAKKIMEAFKKSGKSMSELMTYLFAL